MEVVVVLFFPMKLQVRTQAALEGVRDPSLQIRALEMQQWKVRL